MKAKHVPSACHLCVCEESQRQNLLSQNPTPVSQ